MFDHNCDDEKGTPNIEIDASYHLEYKMTIRDNGYICPGSFIEDACTSLNNFVKEELEKGNRPIKFFKGHILASLSEPVVCGDAISDHYAMNVSFMSKFPSGEYYGQANINVNGYRIPNEDQREKLDQMMRERQQRRLEKAILKRKADSA